MVNGIGGRDPCRMGKLNTTNDSKTTIDLIRHGLPEGGKRYRGSLDDPLSEKGWRQMWATVGEHAPWQVIISSPLSRCADFAHALARRHQIPIVVNNQLKEIGVGEWEGKTSDEIIREQPRALLDYWTDPVNHFATGAEHVTLFSKRVTTQFQQILHQHMGKHILIVGHAGISRAIICHILDIPPEGMFHIHVKNAALSRICVERKGELVYQSLIFHNGMLNHEHT